jgi:hypothetical protein
VVAKIAFVACAKASSGAKATKAAERQYIVIGSFRGCEPTNATSTSVWHCPLLTIAAMSLKN